MTLLPSAGVQADELVSAAFLPDAIETPVMRFEALSVCARDLLAHLNI
jgi:hypothetical protein